MPDIEMPPRAPGASKEFLKDVSSLVILGANGSGKSRLGVQIELSAKLFVHRITAQRALHIPSVVPLRAYEEASDTLLHGYHAPGHNDESKRANKFGRRWSGSEEAVNCLLTDFDHVLGLLFADEVRRDQAYSRAAQISVPTDAPPKCNLQILHEIWSTVFPHRSLLIRNYKLEAHADKGGTYEARHMSDGERVAIYLIGQALCAPRNAIVIIDEPEIHVHRAIQGPLWDQIEFARPDCAFVYITHDLDFAATRTSARKIWLKGFDGRNWEWEELKQDQSLPDALLFQVLGSRRPLLFVEGDETSYDSAIYSALYPKELVVARQSCQKVIEATKSMSELTGVHHLAVRGLVDRDRRGDEEIAALRDAGLLVADVAEVENLLCLPEALQAVSQQLRRPDIAQTTAKAESRVLTELEKAVEQQALSRALSEIQFRLNGFGPKISKSDAAKLEADLGRYLATIDVSAIVSRCRGTFEDIVRRKDYRAALRFYNCKGIVAFVAASLDIGKDTYARLVLSLVKAEPGSPLSMAMRTAVEG